MRAVFATSVVVVTASGCLLGSWNDFTSGGGDAAATDAAIDDAPNADVTKVADAAFNTDAFDATIDAGGGDAFTCSSGTYLLCATFDDGLTSTGWTDVEVQNGGSLGVDPNARSGPFALRAQIPAQTDTPNEYAAVFKSFSGTKSLRIAFDAKLLTPAWTAGDKAVALFLVEWPGTNNASYLFRAIDEMTFSQEQNGVYVPLEPLPYDTWTRVTVEVVPTTPSGSLRIYYDGRVVLAEANVAFESPAANATTLVHVGLARFDPPAPPIDVRFDSVTIEELP